MKLLNEIQQELKAPKNQYNSFGKYHYRSCEDILEGVKPLLVGEGHSLIISDEMVNIGQANYVKATATLSDGATTVEVTGWAREPVARKGMDESQITGCASSYARKYALNGLFCIDDSKDADTDAYNKPAPAKKTPAEKPASKPLAPMNDQEKAAMTSIFLVATKPDGMDIKQFKFEAATKMYAKMGHWPVTQGEQEEAIGILDKEYSK